MECREGKRKSVMFWDRIPSEYLALFMNTDFNHIRQFYGRGRKCIIKTRATGSMGLATGSMGLALTKTPPPAVNIASMLYNVKI